MLAIIKTINGQKKAVPITPEAGSGNPLGSILPMYTTVIPAGYLPCDGSQFDETIYPALYTFLGDNHTPDLREVTLKGIGENPNGAAHVKSGGLAVGEFLDDRIQNHQHNLGDNFLGGYPSAGTVLYVDHNGVNNDTKGVVGARTGATTEVKSVGVNYCIKATSGLEESQQDYVLEALATAGSYSTSEVATGKKWIDGKTIYRKVIEFGSIPNIEKTVAHNISNMDNVISIEGWARDNTIRISLPYTSKTSGSTSIVVNNTSVIIDSPFDFSSYTAYIILEYTKTV